MDLTVFPLPVQIWVNSPHTASGYYTIYDNETLQADHFNTRLSFGDAAQTLWARTGYLGFVRRTELTAASGGTVEISHYLLNEDEGFFFCTMQRISPDPCVWIQETLCVI